MAMSGTGPLGGREGPITPGPRSTAAVGRASASRRPFPGFPEPSVGRSGPAGTGRRQRNPALVLPGLLLAQRGRGLAQAGGTGRFQQGARLEAGGIPPPNGACPGFRNRSRMAVGRHGSPWGAWPLARLSLGSILDLKERSDPRAKLIIFSEGSTRMFPKDSVLPSGAVVTLRAGRLNDCTVVVLRLQVHKGIIQGIRTRKRQK